MKTFQTQAKLINSDDWIRANDRQYIILHMLKQIENVVIKFIEKLIFKKIEFENYTYNISL